MDPISAVIIAVINAGIGEPVKDAYNALKGALQRKFGKDSDVVDAVAKLEKKPESKSRRDMLQEEIATIQAHEDEEINQLAKALLKKIKETAEGKEVMGKFQIKTNKIGAVGDVININTQNF